MSNTRKFDAVTDRYICLDSMGAGAWPVLVGGVVCLVHSVNERDFSLIIK